MDELGGESLARRLASTGIGATSDDAVSGIEQFRSTVNAAGQVINTTITTPAEFNKRTDVGMVFGGGVEFKIKRLRISPEFRYTRWGSENFRDPVRSLLRTNRNQGDFLLGILF